MFHCFIFFVVEGSILDPSYRFMFWSLVQANTIGCRAVAHGIHGVHPKNGARSLTATTMEVDGCHRYRRQTDWIWPRPHGPHSLNIHFADTSIGSVVWHLPYGQIPDSRSLDGRNTSWNPIGGRR